MLKSGYSMINCKGLDLTGGSTPQTIAGLYEQCKTALKSGKAIFAHNCVYGEGHPTSPIAVLVQQEDEHTIVATASILQIWVTDAATSNVHVESLITANRAVKATK